MGGENLILRLSEEFALGVMDFADVLSEQKRYVLANQLLRAGTSVGAMMEEAQTPESRADFRHKCKVAHKEARESAYWLRLCRKSVRYPSPPPELAASGVSIIRVLDSILRSTDRGSQNNQ